MEMASSEVEMSSCQTFNCVLSRPHERCTHRDNTNNKKNKNNNNVRNIHDAFEKNLNVFVRDHFENASVVSGEDVNDSIQAVPECSSSKSSVSDHRVDVSLGSESDPNSGQPENPSRKETRAASSLVQIWEARTTQHPPSSNQSQIDSRTSSTGSSNLLENSESLNEESVKDFGLIQPIQEGNNEEEEEEETECDFQFVVPLPNAAGEKEREGVVRVMDIIRKLSNDSEVMTNHENGSISSNNDSSKEVQTTETRCYPQVACSPRIRGRQALADLLVLMTREREKELATILDRHCVSKFTHRGRIQSTLRIRCYERCIAIQDRHRSKSSSAGSDLNRSPRGSGVMHLILREKYKTNSENIETGASSSSVSSRGWIQDKDPQKATEKKILQETIEKSDLKETQEVKKAVLSESAEKKNVFKKSAESIPKESVEGRGQKREMQEKAVAKESLVKETKEVISAAENAKKAVLSDISENKIGLKKSAESIQKGTTEGRGERQETKEKAVLKEGLEGRGKKQESTKESGEGNGWTAIAGKVNLWNLDDKMNSRKGKSEGKANTETVGKIDLLEEVTRRIFNVQNAERIITTTSREMMMTPKKEEDYVSVEPKSKEIEDRSLKPPTQEDSSLRKKASEENFLQEITEKSDLKKPMEKESREEKRETEETVEESSLMIMGIAEKVNLWNSKGKRNRRRSIDIKGKGKTKGKAPANTETNDVLLKEASIRLSNVDTAERSIAAMSKETVEKVVSNKEMMDNTKNSGETEKGGQKKEEDLASVEAKSKEIIETKTMNSQEENFTSHGSIERTKEKISSQKDEEKFIKRNPNDENGVTEPEDEEIKKVECDQEKGESVKEVEIEYENDWDEEMEEDEYGDYDHFIGENTDDWILDISRPRSYWENLRKERYLEVLNDESEKKDICKLIESRTVSDFLNSELRQKIDNLMITRVQSHIRVPINQVEEEEEDEEEEEWEAECSARNQEDNETEEEPEKTIIEASSDVCSQSSARSSLNLSWNFRDQDIDKDHEPTMTLSLPETPAPTNLSDAQVISDLRSQVEKLHREMLELRSTVKSCVEMQIHFQKSITQDLSRSGSSTEERVDTKKDPLKRKCCVCSEAPVDSLLYRCGHMCTCLKCAHELQWSSKKCPICMAPIVDVVRAFLDS